MKLPSYEDFGALRLKAFVSRGVRALQNWEYADERWVGEAIGFTEILRLERDPEVVRSVAVALVDLPERVQAALLGAIGLPLRRGMTLGQITRVLGKPTGTHKFVPDRTTYEFRVGSPRYRVSCTILAEGGLIYVTMLAPTRP